MIKELLRKMTPSMIWTIIILTAIAILMPVGAYTYVILKSDQITYEGVFGKISAKVSTLQVQLDKALHVNDELTKTVSQLEQNLEDIKKICDIPTHPASFNQSANNLSDKFLDIKKSLNVQSELLGKQKIGLESINRDAIDLKDSLKILSGKQINFRK